MTWYYVGGSIGAALPGAVWSRAGWPGCVGLVIVVLLLIALLAWRFWDRPAKPGDDEADVARYDRNALQVGGHRFGRCLRSRFA